VAGLLERHGLALAGAEKAAKIAKDAADFDAKFLVDWG